MKKAIILAALVGLSFGALIKKDPAATVSTHQGLLLFVQCEPTANYNKLGTLSWSKFWATDNSYTNVRDRFIKECKSKYPDAHGIVLNLDDPGKYYAEAISFD